MKKKILTIRQISHHVSGSQRVALKSWSLDKAGETINRKKYTVLLAALQNICRFIASGELIKPTGITSDFDN
jgi:hypothetical protein